MKAGNEWKNRYEYEIGCLMSLMLHVIIEALCIFQLCINEKV
jgi:hypothetical protein